MYFLVYGLLSIEYKEVTGRTLTRPRFILEKGNILLYNLSLGGICYGKTAKSNRE